jgi:hypothetical protein
MGICLKFHLIPFFLDLVVNKLLTLFFDICLLKAKPQDVPASSVLLVLTVLAGVGSEILFVGLIDKDLTRAIAVGLLDAVLMLGLLRFGLTMLRLPSRFTQTATAMFGSGIIINFIVLGVIQFLIASADGSFGQHLGSLLYVAVLIWGIVIMGHVLRHSFNLRLNGGLLLAVGYFFLVNSLIQTFVPAG